MTETTFGRMGTQDWALTGPEKIPRQLLKELRERRNGPGLMHLAMHFAALAGTGWLVHASLGVCLILALLAGVVAGGLVLVASVVLPLQQRLRKRQ